MNSHKKFTIGLRLFAVTAGLSGCGDTEQSDRIAEMLQTTSEVLRKVSALEGKLTSLESTRGQSPSTTEGSDPSSRRALLNALAEIEGVLQKDLGNDMKVGVVPADATALVSVTHPSGESSVIPISLTQLEANKWELATPLASLEAQLRTGTAPPEMRPKVDPVGANPPKIPPEGQPADQISPSPALVAEVQRLTEAHCQFLPGEQLPLKGGEEAFVAMVEKNRGYVLLIDLPDMSEVLNVEIKNNSLPDASPKTATQRRSAFFWKSDFTGEAAVSVSRSDGAALNTTALVIWGQTDPSVDVNDLVRGQWIPMDGKRVFVPSDASK